MEKGINPFSEILKNAEQELERYLNSIGISEEQKTTILELSKKIKRLAKVAELHPL